jgi:hypothetical protein
MRAFRTETSPRHVRHAVPALACGVPQPLALRVLGTNSTASPSTISSVSLTDPGCHRLIEICTSLQSRSHFSSFLDRGIGTGAASCSKTKQFYKWQATLVALRASPCITSTRKKASSWTWTGQGHTSPARRAEWSLSRPTSLGLNLNRRDFQGFSRVLVPHLLRDERCSQRLAWWCGQLTCSSTVTVTPTPEHPGSFGTDVWDFGNRHLCTYACSISWCGRLPRISLSGRKQADSSHFTVGQPAGLSGRRSNCECRIHSSCA